MLMHRIPMYIIKPTSAVHSKITIKKSSLSLHQKKIVLCTLLTLQPYEYDFVHVQIPKSY